MSWQRTGIVELEEAGMIQLGRGKVISKKDLAATPGNYPVYSSAKENDGKFGEYGEYMFDEELVTWSVDGGGRLFHRPRHRFSITNVGGFVRILDTSRIDCRYMFYALSFLHGQTTFDWVRKAHPSVIRKVYTDFPLPPLEEQKRIVAVLDQAFAALDRARANAEANLADAEELLRETRETLLDPGQSGWQERPLAEMISIKHGFAFKSEFFTSEGDMVLLTPGNFFEGGGFRHRGSKQKFYVGEVPEGFILRKGDLLMAMTEQAPGLLGSCILVPESERFLHNQRLGLIEPIERDQWHSGFFAHVFNTRAFRKSLSDSCTGIKVRHTSPDKIKAVSVPVPPRLDVQARLSDQLDNLTEKTKALKGIYDKKLVELDDLRQSILQKAFAGELT